MPKVLVNDENLTNIANAIREKNGETTTYKPSEMASAIQNISSGGATPEKGIVINKWDSDGYATDVTIVGITQIPSYAFYNYDSSGNDNSGNIFSDHLINANLPNELTYIGASAFSGCRELILNELPSGITSLSKDTFYRCVSITEMVIKGDITSISGHTYSGSFRDCSKLKKVVFLNVTNVPTMEQGAYAFNGTMIAKGTGYIYVPDALVDSFKSETNWSNYADQIKPISELEASA